MISLSGCAEKSNGKNDAEAIAMAIVGITSAKDFRTEVSQQGGTRFTLTLTTEEALRWVYSWPVVSANHDHITFQKFKDGAIINLDASGYLLFKNDNFIYWKNGRSHILGVSCLMSKVNDSVGLVIEVTEM